MYVWGCAYTFLAPLFLWDDCTYIDNLTHNHPESHFSTLQYTCTCIVTSLNNILQIYYIKIMCIYMYMLYMGGIRYKLFGECLNDKPVHVHVYT